MMKKWIVSLILVTMVFVGAKTQELITYEEQGLYSKALIGLALGLPADYDVQVYRIEYTTLDVFMQPDTASGIIAVPVDPLAKFPTLLYDHGTVADRTDVPSEGSYEQFLSVGLASQGYMCVAPDYIGLGISEGLHPYVHPESEAQAGIDLIYAVKELSDVEPIYFNEQLFITGYSQGGHAAMATSKILQETGEMTVTASAPMSGPYSISNVMKSFTLGEEEYFFCAYLGSVTLTAIYAYPDLMAGITIEDLFLPEYAELVRRFEAEELDLFVVNDLMIDRLSQNGGQVLPRRMFKEDILESVWNDPEYPLNQALERMDVHDWVPEMPLKMLYCTADDQVSYRNAVYTDSLMNVMGAADVTSEDVLPTGDHGACGSPAINRMLEFFSEYQRIDLVSTVDRTSLASLVLWPNPASHFLHLNSEVLDKGAFNVEIYDFSGRLCMDKFYSSYTGSISIAELENGLYSVRIIGQDGVIGVARMMVQH